MVPNLGVSTLKVGCNMNLKGSQDDYNFNHFI